jgi:hypothetical protein
MEEITWTTSGEPSPPAPGVKKHPFVREIDIQADMQEGQKNFAQTYNSMREMLLSNGLMNKK